MSLGKIGTDHRAPIRARILGSGATLGGSFSYVNLFDAAGNLVAPGSAKQITPVTASGAITAWPATYVITKAGIAAMTLAAPVVTTDDGKILYLTSSTLFAHTLTATGLLSTGTASVNVATFAAYAGAGLALMAYQGLWIVEYSVGITFS